MDATHIGEELLLAARSPELKSNLAWAWIEEETKESYASLKTHLESKGFTFKGVVIDGRRGIPRVFDGIPVQICQFHQMQTVKRKLTLRPETLAGQELLSISLNLARTNQKTLENKLDEWHIKYQEFLNQKTYTIGCRHWSYTHRRVRSAYLSLKRNMPYLFTHQRYPELNMPNTTNSLDGYWSRVKNLLSAHRGKKKERIRKIVNEILRKQTA